MDPAARDKELFNAVYSSTEKHEEVSRAQQGWRERNVMTAHCGEGPDSEGGVLIRAQPDLEIFWPAALIFRGGGDFLIF